MWKSRSDKLPPPQYFTDLIQHLRNLYPGAAIDAALVQAMRDIWIAEWRNGQSAQDTAKATCSCDGKSIVPSEGAGRDLGKRLARPPKGAKRGDFIEPGALREVSSLSAARVEAEKYSQAFDRVRATTMKLLQTKGWTASKGLRLQKLKELLHEIKGKHDAAVAKYQDVKRGRREAAQPALYEKPLGALGLSLRPDELPEPPPAKDKKPAKEPKPAKPPKEPRTPRLPKASKDGATQPAQTRANKAAWTPPTNLPQSGLVGQLSVTVAAYPNEDFGTSTDPDGQHRATVRIPAQTFTVGSLGAARALVRTFIADHRLGGGNYVREAGRVRLDEKPFAHISYNGRIWRVDGKWKQSQQELDEFGKLIAAADCECKKGTPSGPAQTASASPAAAKTDAAPEVADAPKPESPPKAAAKPKRERKPKADVAAKADASPAEKAALSDAEAEELANLFATASEEDKAR